MKKLLLLSFFSIVFMTGCAIHIPGPYFEDDYFPVTVRLDIDPDDAEVYLDGRLIGEAYEFSSSDTAIRLSSRNHRLAFSKEGYMEMITDLDDYRDRHIMLSLSLRPLPTERTQTAESEQATPSLPAKPVEAVEPPETTDRYVLILTVEAPEATIYINDRFWGIVPEGGEIGRIVFNEKEIKIDILKPGFKPWQKKMILSKEGEELRVVLQAVDK